MDKYEYKIKLDEIRSLAKQRDFEAATEVADTIDWTGVKDVYTLTMISDIYKGNHMFRQSTEILLLAYRKQKTRPIVKSLCELAIEQGDLISALNYLNEFTTIAPNDPKRLILQYKLYKAQGVSLEEQISVLEEHKKYDDDKNGRWAYELAELYHRIGQGDKCVEECNELILWYVDGKFVIKAFELKAQHKPLTEQETYQYELLRQAGGELNIEYSLREDEKEGADEKSELEVKKVDVSPYNTQSLQAVVAEGLQDIIDQKTIQMDGSRIPESYEEAVAMDKEARQGVPAEETSAGDGDEEEDLLITQVIDPVLKDEPVGQELLEKETGELPEELPETESPEGGEAEPEEQPEEPGEEEEAFTPLADVTPVTEETPVNPAPEPVIPDTVLPEPVPEAAPVSGPRTIMPSAKAGTSTGIIEKFHYGTNMDEILSQEYDGQISLVVTEEKKPEKQITGQISINDVMEEWDRKKKESEEKRIAEVRQRIRKETDALLADFEESTKSGLLEQIEDAMISAARREEHERNVQARPKEIKVSDIEKPAESLVGPDTEEIIQNALKEELNEKEEEKKLPDEELTLEDTIPEETDEDQTAAEPSDEETEGEEYPDENEEEVREDLPDEDEEEADEDLPDEDEEEADEDLPEEEEEETDEEPSDEDLPEEEDEESSDEEESPEGEAKEADTESSAEDAETSEGSDETPDEEAEKAKDTPKKKSGEDTKTRSGKTKKLNAEEVRSIAKASKEAEESAEDGKKHARELTDQERERFARFIHHRSTRRQLADTLENVTLAAYTGNILVTGEEETELTAFSKLLIHEIQSSDNNFVGKVAKVSGENLNRKEVAQTIQTVANGALIISDAEKLKGKTVNSLLSALQSNEMGVVVILEGRSDTADKLIEKISGFSDTFNLRVDLHAFDNKTLVEYARSYAYEREYGIDELGILALHTRLDDMQTAEHEVTLAEIEDIIEEAIYYADRKTPAHFFDVLFGKRYDEEDMIVLREKDFMHY